MPGPPRRTGEGLLEYRDAADRAWLGIGEPMRGISWQLWVRLPADTVTARAEAFAARTTWIGVVIVLAGALGGWLLSRRISGPLKKLTRAATAMARGDLGQRVEIRSGNELGALAGAFNAMAGRVRSSSDELERRIAARTAELSTANEELKDFSYSVSHDLRAPLRAINGFSTLLRDDHAAGLDDEGRAFLARILAAVGRMERLIDDLLELSRVARQEMRRETVDLAREAEDAVAELRAASSGREVDVRIAPGLRALGDSRLLRLVLQNLLGNAWKFTSRIPDARIEIGTVDGPERAFFVRDNGAGFDMAYVDKIFGVFQRLHSPSEFPGTGVGLAIVHRIVQRHGGRAWAEGAVNKGATFYFTLPAA